MRFGFVQRRPELRAVQHLTRLQFAGALNYELTKNQFFENLKLRIDLSRGVPSMFKPDNVIPAISRALATGAAALFLVTPASANLVTNGDFETGTLSGWSVGNAVDNQNWQSYTAALINNAPAPLPGSTSYATTGCGSFCSLSQGLATTAGQAYTLSFAYNSGSFAQNAGPTDLQVFWGTSLLTPVFDFNGPTPPDKSGNPDWAFYSVTLFASSADTELTFKGEAGAGMMGLDNINVSAVPEPSTWVMLISGFLGLGFLAYRRRPHAAFVA